MYQKADGTMALTGMKEGTFYLFDSSGDFFCDYVAFALWDGCILMADAWDEDGGLRFAETPGDQITYMVRPLESVDLSASLEDAYDTLLELYHGSANGVVDMSQFYVFTTDDPPGQVLERGQRDYSHRTLRA